MAVFLALASGRLPRGGPFITAFTLQSKRWSRTRNADGVDPVRMLVTTKDSEQRPMRSRETSHKILNEAQRRCRCPSPGPALAPLQLPRCVSLEGVPWVSTENQLIVLRRAVWQHKRHVHHEQGWEAS